MITGGTPILDPHSTTELSVLSVLYRGNIMECDWEIEVYICLNIWHLQIWILHCRLGDTSISDTSVYLTKHLRWGYDGNCLDMTLHDCQSDGMSVGFNHQFYVVLIYQRWLIGCSWRFSTLNSTKCCFVVWMYTYIYIYILYIYG